ncbi:MAG: hypothetical protein Q4B08_15305 [Propionibacteriaceae bacterium]|nr:hypothetical protein [Propionibacteriaceae bacterium]
MRRVAMFLGAVAVSAVTAIPAYAGDESASVPMAAAVPDLLPLVGVIGVIMLAGFGYRKAGG